MSARSSEEILETYVERVAEAIGAAIERGEPIDDLCAVVAERSSPVFASVFVAVGDVFDGECLCDVMTRAEAVALFDAVGKPEVCAVLREPCKRGDVPLVVCCAEVVLCVRANVGIVATAPGSVGVLS